MKQKKNSQKLSYLFSILMLLVSALEGSPPRILIKIPTRSRPEQFFKNLTLFCNKLSGQIPVHFIITCDENDTLMNTPLIKERLAHYKNTTVFWGSSDSKIAAYNRDLDLYKDHYDILILASDDMEPLVDGYDQIIADAMEKNFPDFDGVLHFDDGNVGPQCNIMPIIGRKFYNRFGYAYCPAYKAAWCDVELTEVARILRKDAYVDNVIIRHNHPGRGIGVWDALYLHNESFCQQDEVTFFARREKSFFLDTETIDGCCSKLWSILIVYDLCQQEKYDELLRSLNTQIKALDLAHDIEIITSTDPWSVIHYYEHSLLRQSRGKYLSYLNGLCQISYDYIASIYTVLKEVGPDCVALRGLRQKSDGALEPFEQSINYKKQCYKEQKWCEYVNLLSPIRQSITVRCFFPYKNSWERFTWEWGLGRSNLIKHEVSMEKYLITVSA